MAAFDRYANESQPNKTEEQAIRSMLRKRFLRSLMHNAGMFATRDAEADKFLWKRKHFEERSWKRTRKHFL